LKKRIKFVTGFSLALILLVGCGAPVVKMAANPEEQFSLAKHEFDKKHWLKATEGFQKVIFNFPGATVVDTAQYYLALSYFQSKDYELAAVEFKRLISNYPRSSFVDQSQYMAGVCYLRNTPGHYALDQEDLKKATESLQDFIIDNPDSPLIEDAKKAIAEGQTKLARKDYESGMVYFKMYDYAAATVYFQYVIDNYTSSEYAESALYRLAESAFKQAKYADAAGKFNNFISIYPSSKLIPKTKEYLQKITRQLETVDASSKS